MSTDNSSHHLTPENEAKTVESLPPGAVEERDGSLASVTDTLRSPTPKPPSERRTSSAWYLMDPSPVGGLTYVDFLPMRKDDRFSMLVDQANSWLQDHPDWEVRTCESVEFLVGSGSIHFLQFEKMTFFDDDDTVWMRFARGFRLWVVQRLGQTKTPQTLAYFNIIPKVDETFCGKPHFQTLDATLDRINEVIQDYPIEGKILTVETLRIKFSPFQRSIDPERTLYRDHGYNLYVLRVFYEKGETSNEMIGLEDFKPNCIQLVGPLRQPKYEDFTAVIRKVQDWCTRKRGNLRVLNVQTLLIKIKNGEVNTQRMFFTEHKDQNFQTHFARIIRVTYAQPIREMQSYPEQKPVRICCRTFLPVQLSTRGFFSPPNFETMSQTRDRIAIWILQNNARVVGAETCAVRMYTGGERFDGPDATYTFSCGPQNEHWIYVFRLFLDGRYPGPPAEMDRSAFQVWNQDPLTVATPQRYRVDDSELCVLQ